MTKQYSLKYNNLLKHVGRVGWKETIRAQGKIEENQTRLEIH